MKTLTIRDLRQRWPRAEALLAHEAEIIITRDGKPIAKLVRLREAISRRKRFDPHKHARWQDEVNRGGTHADRPPVVPHGTSWRRKTPSSSPLSWSSRWRFSYREPRWRRFRAKLAELRRLEPFRFRGRSSPEIRGLDAEPVIPHTTLR